jgi:hypothetical protein
LFKCLSYSADTEWVLAMIITKIFFRQQDQFCTYAKKAGVKKKLLNRFTLEEKAKVSKYSLKEFHSNLYEKYEKDFDQIEQLRNLRNKFAHGRIMWNDITEDKNTLQISMLQDNHIETVSYDRITLWEELMNYSFTMNNLLRLVQTFLHIE